MTACFVLVAALASCGPQDVRPQPDTIELLPEDRVGIDTQRSLTGEATPLASKIFMLHAGAVSFAPRRVVTGTDGKKELADSERDTQGYVEAYFRNRCAWLGGKSLGRTQPHSQSLSWLVPTDQTARIGFTFGSDSEDASAPTSVSATTLAGSGEFYADVGFGWGIGALSACEQGQPFNHTINLEVRAGWVTDANQDQLHGYYLGGLTSVWGFFMEENPVANPDTRRRIELLMGLDFGISEFPAVETLDADRTTIRTEGGDLRFSRRTSVGLRAEVNFPVGDTGYLVLSGRAFDTMSRPFNQAEWNLMVGFAVPFGFISK